MKRGKGQISVFIIIAVIIIVVAGVALFVSQNKTDDDYFSSNEVKPGFDKLISSIIECHESIAQESLELIGLQGGYYTQSEKNVLVEGVFIPYYYYDGIISYPDKEEVDKNLEQYVNDKLGACLKNIKSDFEIMFKAIKTEVRIREKKVDLSSHVNIKINKDGKNTFFELKNYPVEIDSELNAILDLAYYYIDSHKENPELYCIDCVAEMAEKNNLYFDLVPLTQDTSLIIISENHTASSPYSFEFLNKYIGNEKGIDVFEKVTGEEDSIEAPITEGENETQ